MNGIDQHLTPEALSDWRARRLSAEELLQADTHLAACEVCRGRLDEELAFRNACASLRAAVELGTDEPAEHLEYEELSAYLSGELDEFDREIADGHLGYCAECAAELKALRRRAKLLEQENEVLKRAAAYLSQANLKLGGSGK